MTDAVSKANKDFSLLSEEPFFWEAEDESDSLTVDQLIQSYILTPFDARDAYLVYVVQKFTQENPQGLVIVFVKTCKSAQLISMTLNKLGFQVVLGVG
jgi:superfamily II DNA/RNA helicase